MSDDEATPGEAAMKRLIDVSGLPARRMFSAIDQWGDECVEIGYAEGERAATERIVAWLRTRGAHGMVPMSQAAQDFADIIERDGARLGEGDMG